MILCVTAELATAAAEDVRTLARLYQLQNKMEAVGRAGAYDARLERVLAARAAVEERLLKRLDLIDGYARVINMIEIEVRPSYPNISMVSPLRQLSSMRTFARSQH